MAKKKKEEIEFEKDFVDNLVGVKKAKARYDFEYKGKKYKRGQELELDEKEFNELDKFRFINPIVELKVKAPCGK